MGIVLKLIRIFQSILVFLSIGLIMADLKAEGTEPKESDSLITSRIGLFSTGSSSLKRLDGMGSNMQVIGLEAVTRLVKASGEIILDCERV